MRHSYTKNYLLSLEFQLTDPSVFLIANSGRLHGSGGKQGMVGRGSVD